MVTSGVQVGKTRYSHYSSPIIRNGAFIPSHERGGMKAPDVNSPAKPPENRKVSEGVSLVFLPPPLHLRYCDAVCDSAGQLRTTMLFANESVQA
jgi:hypothetical protein